MTTTHNPDQLRAEIDQTRAHLSQNVNALGEAVTPGNIARRQADKAKGAAVGVKDKVMGSAEDTASHVSGSVGDAGQTVKARAHGNPLAAGVIALGAGWLLGSLLPATSKEQQAATALKDQAAPLIDQAQALGKDAAHDVADQLKEPAREAADSVKTTAQDAAHHVQAEGQSAAHDVTASAQESRNKLA